MISYYASASGRLGQVERPGPDGWIHVCPPFASDELSDLAERYELPIDFLTDPLDIDERSRYEREDDARLIVINTPVLSESETENDSIYITVPIGIILTPEALITITSAREHPVLQLFHRQQGAQCEYGASEPVRPAHLRAHRVPLPDLPEATKRTA